MLEIIALIFLSREVGKLAVKKGLKVFNWKLYTVLAWVGAEMIGIFIGFMIFGKDNLISVELVGLTFAITSYFIIKGQLEKMPDNDLDNDISNIGRR
jgi:hypothetical protein